MVHQENVAVANVAFEPKEKHPGFLREVLDYSTEAGATTRYADFPGGQVTTTLVAWAGGYVVPSGEIRPAVRTPQVYYADIDVATASFVLLLEDLAPAQAGTLDRLRLLDLHDQVDGREEALDVGLEARARGSVGVVADPDAQARA